jgi:predicted transport protein
MIPNVGSLKEADRGLAEAFSDLHELKVDTAFPFLLELYGDYDHGLLSRDEFLAAVRLIEAYVFRRVVCQIPTNTLNKTFAGFGKTLRKDRYLESIEANFLSMRTYRRFPSDDEFRAQFAVRDLYNMRQRSFWLRRFENHGRKERVPVEDYTIEHIMPQNEAMPEAWKDELGPDWKRVHETRLHTLGNLTLTGYNSEYRDHPFATKRDMEGGFASSPLRLNRGLGQATSWNENDIAARATRLAQEAVAIWQAPNLADDVLRTYSGEERTTSAYSISDHPNLGMGPTRRLFDAFRREVMALDEGVKEEFLKLYVAYKAETNFADVVPQVSSLRVSLNMRFSDVVDPRGRCRDVSNLGRWGNGDVEIKVESLDDIPYVVGLARQALELQIGGDDTPDCTSA